MSEEIKKEYEAPKMEVLEIKDNVIKTETGPFSAIPVPSDPWAGSQGGDFHH